MGFDCIIFVSMPFDRVRFREMREKYGSREKAGEAIGVTGTTIQMWETTEDANPGIKYIAAAAKLFKTTFAYIVGETNNPAPDALKNFRLMVDDGDLADVERMKLLERELEIITELRHERDKQIRANLRGGKNSPSGN